MDCSFLTNIAFHCLTLAQNEAPVVETSWLDDVWFGIPVGGDVVAPKEYALGTTTRNGNVVLNIVDGALSVKTHSGSTKWNMEGDGLIGDARTGEVNLPTQEQ